MFFKKLFFILVITYFFSNSIFGKEYTLKWYNNAKVLDFIEMKSEEIQADLENNGLQTFDLFQEFLANLNFEWREDQVLTGNSSNWGTRRAIRIKPGFPKNQVFKKLV